MTRSAALLALLVALLDAVAATPARAQEATVQPPPVYDYAPPPRYASPVDPVELEHRGRKKKVAGAVLIGLGTALSVAGFGFAVDGALHAQCSGHEEHAVCTPSFATTELQLGPTAVLLGQVMTVVGIPVYVVGGRKVARARRLSGQLGLQPVVGGAAGALASFSVRL